MKGPDYKNLTIAGQSLSFFRSLPLSQSTRASLLRILTPSKNHGWWC